MNKSNKTLTLSTSLFVFVSFFIMPVSVANADVSFSGIMNAQMCGDFLAAEDKKKGKDGKDEEEPDCE